MKNTKFELLFIVLLLAAAIWTQLQTSSLPVLMGLGLIPLFGSVIATNPPKSPKRQSRL